MCERNNHNNWNLPSNSGFINKHTVMGGAGKGAELDPRKETINMQNTPKLD